MAASSGNESTEAMDSSAVEATDRLKMLYPAVNEEEYPLPRSWSPKDKFNYIGLSQNNLRVHYRGVGKTHKDAASVRTTHPIPSACGIYYFEVKVISKGRDGYMGIGLAAQGVNMNRLPGWDKNSYGYHGDDGNSFCSSGTGQSYGPTFTTGDVIGCCVNLIENTCFYTKNGVNLGVAFTDLPPNLYPTVGLQTPGEVVEANFGQTPFVYDIEDYIREWRQKTRLTIERFPVSDNRGEWQTALQKIVSTYLVHHGYCGTAEAFAKSTGQSIDEDIISMKNRQRIQRLILAGRMGEAIETTQQLYPGLLEHNLHLLFTLKCRQFIEIVNGTDSEVRGHGVRSPRSHHSSNSNRSSPNLSPVHGTISLSLSQRNTPVGSRGNSPNRPLVTKGSNPGHLSANSNIVIQNNSSDIDDHVTSVSNGIASSFGSKVISDSSLQGDVEMADGVAMDNQEALISNGTVECSSNNAHCTNGESHNNCSDLKPSGMDVDSGSSGNGRRQLCGGNQSAIVKMLQFGKELNAMSQQLERKYGKNEQNSETLQNAFSLLAYSDPWSSPMGYQLDPVQRESVCSAVNSAILELNGHPKRPPLELVIAQGTECMKLMSKSGIGSSAFCSLADYLN